ncbi:Forkhead-associated (FHA) domain-containing protein [Dioscorea alata]|nr:Forkhead-associated (FHA) domain-containing protein [Dioscorea alata]
MEMNIVEVHQHGVWLVTKNIYQSNKYLCIYPIQPSRIRRKLEAKDAARGALKSPWWKLGCEYHVEEIAQWVDEQIEFIKNKVRKDGKLEDLKKGKAPEQVSLDETLFLLDLDSVEGTWTNNINQIAECYKRLHFQILQG